eukprot:c9117_g1_i1.p1 GENE.c9117_g1_i1~~c9117_g1_i1.p1  ORF type:complete len:581 (+),score=163.22 c9117_g1_i1:1-1743(+)
MGDTFWNHTLSAMTDSDLSDVVISGYLKKNNVRGMVHKTSVRFFTLHKNGVLEYFQRDQSHQSKGSIDVTIASSVSLHDGVITLVTADRNWNLSSPQHAKTGNHSLEDWYHALLAAKRTHTASFVLPTEDLVLHMDCKNSPNFVHDKPIQTWTNLASGAEGKIRILKEKSKPPIFDETGAGGLPCVIFMGASYVTFPPVPAVQTIFAVVWVSSSSPACSKFLALVPPNTEVSSHDSREDAEHLDCERPQPLPESAKYIRCFCRGSNPPSPVDTTENIPESPGLWSTFTPHDFAHSGHTWVNCKETATPENTSKWHVVTFTSAEPVQNVEVVIGSVGGGAGFVGAIAEVLVYGRSMADNERRGIEKSLIRKWLAVQRPVLRQSTSNSSSIRTSSRPGSPTQIIEDDSDGSGESQNTPHGGATPIRSNNTAAPLTNNKPEQSLILDASSFALHQPSCNCWVGSPQMWQTFQSPTAGTLSQISFQYINVNSPTTLRIFEGQGTTGKELSWTAMPTCNSIKLTSIHLREPISVQKNRWYTVLVDGHSYQIAARKLSSGGFGGRKGGNNDVPMPGLDLVYACHIS